MSGIDFTTMTAPTRTPPVAITVANMPTVFMVCSPLSYRRDRRLARATVVWQQDTSNLFLEVPID
jgi:hypothetical protein